MAKKDTAIDYAIALYQTTQGLKGSALDEAVANFAKLLIKRGLERQTAKISAAFVAYAKKQDGVVSIEISSAHKLDTAMIESIKKTFGEKVESTQKIDAQLLGGVSIKTADKIFDASLRSQLNKLKSQLQT